MTRFSRREFLEDSIFTSAAAVLAGATFPQSMFAEENQSSAPSERLRVAVLGVNGRGRSHVGAFMKRKDTEVVAIVDPDESVGMKKGVAMVEKKTGKKPAFYRDLRKVLDDKSIDIVTIATPNHWHSLAAIWAVQAGKDVYVEKPVSHNVSEGRRLVQAARKYQKIVQTGTQSRSNGGTIQAMEYLHAGKIGKIQVARGLCYKPRGSIGPRGNYDVPASVDYNIWLGPAPMANLTRKRFHYDWHWQWPYGCGDLGNQGIHQMDLARWGLGVSDLGNSVVSYGGRFSYVDAGDTANTQISIHEYDNDQRLVFEVRGLKTKPFRGAKIGVIFHGTEGDVVLTSYSGGVAFDKDGKQVKKFGGGGDHFGNFIKAVRSRKVGDLNADIEQGHLSSALCHLGNLSYRQSSSLSSKQVEERLQGDKEASETFGRFAGHLVDNKINLEATKIGFGTKLTLDGKKEVFTGKMASKMNPQLSREYRKGFEVPTEAHV